MAHRFFNATLREEYGSCVLPTLEPFAAAPNAVTASEYARFRSPKHVFHQHIHKPPPDRCDRRPRPDLSSAFAPPDDDPAPSAPKKQKRRKREVEGQLRTYKVRMIPTPEQARELKRCFAAARHAYNHTVHAINEGGARINFYERRKAYKDSGEQPPWAKGVATKFVAGAVEQAVNAYRSNFAKRDLHAGHTFDVHYRSHRKAKTEVLRVEGDGGGGEKPKTSPLLAFRPVPFANNPDLRSECLALFGNNLKATGGIRLQDKPHVVARLLAEGTRLRETCRIQWEKRTNAFYFIYVYDRPALADPDPQFETKRLAATDPGVRKFQTWWSPTSGEHGELFVRGRAQLEQRCFDLDALISKVAKRGNAQHSDRDNPQRARHVQRRTAAQRRRTYRALKRQLARERRRLHDWMAQGHYAAANFLLRRFDVVVAPRLQVAALVPRNGRVFGSSTARAMHTWSHGLFAERLQSTAFRYAGRHVIADSGEPGTSRTCAHCGHWHAALGGDHVFECPRCGVKMDRDVAGARNNFFAAFGRACGVGWDGLQR